jgi:malic enzyme
MRVWCGLRARAVLIGLSGAGKLFTKEILEAFSEGCQHQAPVVMPMSNPTGRMECSAEEAQLHTGGRAVFASGSPQEDVEWNGQTIASTQANNMCVLHACALPPCSVRLLWPCLLRCT